MNNIDILLVSIVIIGMIAGYAVGFITSIFGLIKWSCIFLSAYFGYEVAAGLIGNNFRIEQQWLKPVGFLLIFILSLLFISPITNWSNNQLQHRFTINFYFRLAGILPGLVAGIIAAWLTVQLLALSSWQNLVTQNNSSVFATALQNIYQPDITLIEGNTLTLSAVKGVASSPTNPNEKHAGFVCEHYQERPDLEAQLLVLVNKERSIRNLPMLVNNASLQLAAVKHASDMYNRGYFSHNTPEGASPFDRMKKRNISYLFAGENLAHSYNVAEAHTGLMNSPGHRANILSKDYRKAGISILDGGKAGLMLVQEFSN